MVAVNVLVTLASTTESTKVDVFNVLERKVTILLKQILLLEKITKTEKVKETKMARKDQKWKKKFLKKTKKQLLWLSNFIS